MDSLFHILYIKSNSFKNDGRDNNNNNYNYIKKSQPQYTIKYVKANLEKK